MYADDCGPSLCCQLRLNTGPNCRITIFSKLTFSPHFWHVGKTGINCFLLITGYFMCKSSISVRKFLKLLLEIYFYRITIFIVFFLSGYEELSFSRVIRLLSPVWGFHTNFTSCFLAFWLTIPFLNVLVQHLNRVLHARLICLSLAYYSVLSIIPGFYISFNYITWFIVLYFVASYIRLYPIPIFQKKEFLGLGNFGFVPPFCFKCTCL